MTESMTVLTEPPSLVAEQFEDAGQQKESSTLGMWTFLATEVLFFGVLFVGYAVYRLRWPEAFRRGSLDLKWYLGAVNTAVLLVSSFTMAMAVRSAALGLNRLVVRNLALTILLAICFLGIKSTEYYLEYAESLVPGPGFSQAPPDESQESAVVRAFNAFDRATSRLAGAGEVNKNRPREEELFMTYYFVMTALHATHMVVGIGVMIVLIVLTRSGRFSAEYHTPVEMAGLYWHFVDLVWVFLFPILYLLRNP